MKPCNGYTIDVIVNLPIADLNCALIWSLSIVLKVNWNPTTGKIFFMSTCVYLIIFLANDLLPLYLTEKSVKQLPQLYSKIVSVFLPFSKLFPCSHDTLVYFLFTSLGVACGHSCFFLRLRRLLSPTTNHSLPHLASYRPFRNSGIQKYPLLVAN